MLARLPADVPTMQLLLVCASTCWVGHNLVTGSAFALSCDSLTRAARLTAIWQGRNIGPRMGRRREGGHWGPDVRRWMSGQPSSPSTVARILAGISSSLSRRRIVQD